VTAAAVTAAVATAAVVVEMEEVEKGNTFGQGRRA